jgi:hypothetical protein
MVAVAIFKHLRFGFFSGHESLNFRQNLLQMLNDVSWVQRSSVVFADDGIGF